MPHIRELDNTSSLKSYQNMMEEMNRICNEHNIDMGSYGAQVCLTDIEENSDNILRGYGSLAWDISHDEEGNLIKTRRENIMKDIQFCYLCNQFKGTIFEEIYNALSEDYLVGRTRIMVMEPKQCLLWHHDASPRIHYPFKTQEGCFMVILDEVKHLKEHTWYYTETRLRHSAFNGSSDRRFHLVASVFDKNQSTVT